MATPLYLMVLSLYLYHSTLPHAVASYISTHGVLHMVVILNKHPIIHLFLAYRCHVFSNIIRWWYKHLEFRKSIDKTTHFGHMVFERNLSFPTLSMWRLETMRGMRYNIRLYSTARNSPFRNIIPCLHHSLAVYLYTCK